MLSGRSVRGDDETGRRERGSACWLRLALGVFGLFWVAAILYLANYLGITA